MTSKPVLSILLPTYNRSSFLEGLLSEIEIQLQDICDPGAIEVVIGDNCSQDSTPSVITKFISRNPHWKAYRRRENNGPDSNIFSLFVESSGSFRWVFGDDDLPRRGLLSLVLKTLRQGTYHLLYLPSLWSPDISSIQLSPLKSFPVRPVRNIDFARKYNIWITFISSWIFNADLLLSEISTLEDVSKGVGSEFVQLGWILPLMTRPASVIGVPDEPCVYATAANTGGYSILKTFLVNYPSLVSVHTRQHLFIRRALIEPAVFPYLTSLIIAVRSGNIFRDAGPTSGVLLQAIRYLWKYPSFWLFCVPAMILPRFLLLKLLSCRASLIRFWRR